ncbi:GFA family protein [Aspergillus alliaceus]|uniref:GFA family protein n=1 Tax=Petromyces alliaceus TaxID=209559 RepID=UPI0012A72B13|nr:Mss4-like protein [Aspergillus alliaceus]KAB8233403.1 Mss4-like protein [Aspergillus alliaceus]
MADDVPAGGDPLPNPVSGTTNEASWKHRAPYKIQTDEEFGPVKWIGRCQCGQVEYKLNREKPLKSKYCHCRGCQVLHGAPFQWATIFHKADLTFTKGADGLAFYSSTEKSREYMLPTKVSCSFCRTPIMDEGRNVCLLFPAAIDYGGTHEGRERWIQAFEVGCHIFYSRRAVEIPDGKPKWSELDESSELLDDSGNPKKGKS